MKGQKPIKKIGYFQEKVLFFRLKSGDQEAFGRIYDLYVDKIYRYIYFKVIKIGSKEEAEDLTSETFLKIWDYINREENIDIEIGNPKALLYKIARNLVASFYRQGDWKKFVNLSGEFEHIDDKQDIEEKIILDHEMSQIENALHYLKDEYQEAIILKYIEGFSDKEIAKILDKTIGAVRTLLYRALQELKEILKKE